MEGATSYDRDVESLKATELRLGLPGSSSATRGNKRKLDDDSPPESAKAQIVGWPPVRSYRKKRTTTEPEAASGTFVKVGMDGAPYLRKIDLKVYEGYEELREALGDMFKCFSSCNEGRDVGCDYAVAYEDKDGDWMLVGDVPWGMFITSCKRLRIMRGSDARGFGSNP